MNEPLMRIVKRIDDFRDKVAGQAADKDILQEVELLTTFLKEVFIKGLQWEEDLWKEKIKLHEERNSLLTRELDSRKTEWDEFVRAKERQSRELLLKLEAVQKEYAETIRMYEERLKYADAEKAQLNDMLVNGERSWKQLLTMREKELGDLTDEVGTLGSEVKSVVSESEKLKRDVSAMKLELDTSRSNAEKLEKQNLELKWNTENADKIFIERMKVLKDEASREVEAALNKAEENVGKAREAFTSEKKALQARLDALTADFEAEKEGMREENKALHERLVAKEREYEEYRVTKEAEEEGLVKKLEASDKQIQSVTGASEEVRKLIATYDKELANIKQENDNLRKRTLDIEEKAMVERAKFTGEAATRMDFREPAKPMISQDTGALSSAALSEDIVKMKTQFIEAWEQYDADNHKSLMDMVEILARGFAHRLRNYIGIISSTIQLSVSELDEKSLGSGGLFHRGNQDKISSVKNDLQSMVFQLDDMGKTIKTFVELARMPEIVKQEFNIFAELRSALAGFNDKMKEGKVDVKFVGDQAAKCNADKKTMREAFSDIILNAIEAMPEGGFITFELAAGQVGGIKGYSLKISDTGDGIQEHVLGKVFQPFFSSKAGRDGLGLPRARRNLLLNRGNIKIESKHGAGTSVEMVFPEGSKV